MKKIFITSFLAAVTLAVAVSCGGGTAETQREDATAEAEAAEYIKISAEEAKEMLDASEDEILLDVRTSSEFTEGHIPGAILLPDNEVSEKAGETLPDKDALILVYCRSGRRSANAAKALIEMGYTNVYDFGGITDWPYEVMSGGV